MGKAQSCKNWNISAITIVYTASCRHPAIQYSILHFCQIIDSDLKSAVTVLTNLHYTVVDDFPIHFKIPLPAKVNTSHVTPE